MTHPVFKLLGYAEADFRAGLAKITEARAHLAAAGLTEDSASPWVCGDCAHLSFRTQRLFLEHRHVLHGEPHPDDEPAVAA